jgi:uncharacterized protein
MPDQRWTPALILSIVLGACAVVCTLLVARAAVRIKTGNAEMIRVTGSARKMIRSDFIIWHGRVVTRAPDIASAYKALKADIDKTKAYLAQKGVPEKEILDAPIVTRTLYAPPTKQEMGYPGENVFRKILGYELSQQVEVRSSSVDLVDGLARKATELLSAGVVFESDAPEYIYTKLGEMKITMLAEAAKDARARADQIARNSGCRLGDVRYAKMSPMRITPAYTVTEVDAFGTNDTTSLDKDITAVVSVGYSIK